MDDLDTAADNARAANGLDWRDPDDDRGGMPRGCAGAGELTQGETR